MRFSSLIMVIVMTVMLWASPQTAQAKHNYFANMHPTTNYLHRCLGIGWSDGYHSSGGWTKKKETRHFWHMPKNTRMYGWQPHTNWPSQRFHAVPTTNTFHAPTYSNMRPMGR